MEIKQEAHRHGSKLWLPDTEVFSVVSGEGAGRGPSVLGVTHWLHTGSCRTDDEPYSCFSLFFFYESENSTSDFFQFMKIDTNVCLSSKQGGVK